MCGPEKSEGPVRRDAIEMAIIAQTHAHASREIFSARDKGRSPYTFGLKSWALFPGSLTNVRHPDACLNKQGVSPDDGHSSVPAHAQLNVYGQTSGDAYHVRRTVGAVKRLDEQRWELSWTTNTVFSPHPLFLRSMLIFKGMEGTSVPYTLSRATSYCGRGQSFAYWLFRSQLELWFFGVLAAKWRFGSQKCSQYANSQPERQFAAQTSICSQNANSTQLGILQPKRQFAADC